MKYKIDNKDYWLHVVYNLVWTNKGDTWNEEKAIALCYMKRMCGNDSSYNNILRANGCFK